MMLNNLLSIERGGLANSQLTLYSRAEPMCLVFSHNTLRWLQGCTASVAAPAFIHCKYLLTLNHHHHRHESSSVTCWITQTGLHLQYVIVPQGKAASSYSSSSFIEADHRCDTCSQGVKALCVCVWRGIY